MMEIISTSTKEMVDKIARIHFICFSFFVMWKIPLFLIKIICPAPKRQSAFPPQRWTQFLKVSIFKLQHPIIHLLTILSTQNTKKPSNKGFFKKFVLCIVFASIFVLENAWRSRIEQHPGLPA